jgi:hypothetical protein
MNAKPATQAPNVVKAPKADKAEKPKKVKVVRDSFTIPKPEFEKIDALKKRALALGVSVKKSELLRAGLLVLSAMSDTAFKAAVANVPVLKTGRPEAEAKAVAPKPTTQQVSAKKPAAKKPATKKPAAKRPAAKRPVVKPVSTATKKAPLKRVVTKKASPVQKAAPVKAVPAKAV